MKVEDLLHRLSNYPGAHENEHWKLEMDLTKCTPKEKAKMAAYGLTPDDFMQHGLNRGEVAHILNGYLHTK